MELSKNIVLILTILLITCALTDSTGSPSEDTNNEKEDEAPKWWENWYRDSNHNKIDDLIEDLEPWEKIGIFINYECHPEEEDIERLSSFDLDVKYVYNYIDVICARNVVVFDVPKISELPRVVMVKIEPKIYPALDVSARAIKARESDLYSPYTAFDLGFTGDDISIAILDTGVDDGGALPNQHHESLDDLDDNPSTTDPKFKAGVDLTQEESVLAPRDGSFNPDDTHSHGTHCAGVAMGTGGETGGGQHIGVAPQARLIDVRVGEVWGGNAGDSIAGIEWCIQHKNEFNIRVLSCSFGSRFGESDGTDEESQTVNNAADAGLIVVAAMGNDGENRVTAPAASDKAIAVGSVDDMGTVDRSDDTLSDFSNTGPRQDDGDDDHIDELKPDVVAYGDDITAAQANTNSGTVTYSGTSMSTPHVAGVVALILHANSELTPEQVKKVLRVTAEPRGEPSYPDLDPKYNTHYGWGIVDAGKAVDMAAGFRDLTISIDHPSEDTIVSGTIEIMGSASVIMGGGSVGSVEVSIDDINFQSEVLTAEGTTEWSVSWNTAGYDGPRTIYAKATSGEYSAIASIDLIVDNSVEYNGDGGQEGDEGPPTINLGFMRVSIYAAAAFIGIIAFIIVAIVAAVVLRRRRMYRELLAARQAQQGQEVVVVEQYKKGLR
ncbi:MAG: S8 family serine peptidase [Thermoplasmata archaeon]|nr:MAG: S8 family serine peptidase [Thermoplasmata archaeon]